MLPLTTGGVSVTFGRDGKRDPTSPQIPRFPPRLPPPAPFHTPGCSQVLDKPDVTDGAQSVPVLEDRIVGRVFSIPTLLGSEVQTISQPISSCSRPYRPSSFRVRPLAGVQLFPDCASRSVTPVFSTVGNAGQKNGVVGY